MVLRVGAERAVGAFLKTADTVVKTFHAWQCPLAGECLRIATEWTVIGIVRLCQSGSDARQICNFGYAEQLAAITKITVGKQNDRGHVLQCQFGGSVCPIEAVGTARCGNHNKRSLAVASVESLSQVALFRLGRQTCRGTATLHVDDDERQFGHHGKTQGLTLQAQAGA